MKLFTETLFWIALKDPLDFLRSNGISTLDVALDDFIVEIQNYCREENNLAERTRTLRYVQTQLMAHKERCSAYGSGKKRAYR